VSQCKTACVWDPFNSTSERCCSWCQSYQSLEHTSKFLASATMDETGFSERKSVGGMCEWKRGCCVSIGVGSSVIADLPPSVVHSFVLPRGDDVDDTCFSSRWRYAMYVHTIHSYAHGKRGPALCRTWNLHTPPPVWSSGIPHNPPFCPKTSSILPDEPA
jgi:hypothetical protein